MKAKKISTDYCVFTNNVMKATYQTEKEAMNFAAKQQDETTIYKLVTYKYQ